MTTTRTDYYCTCETTWLDLTPVPFIDINLQLSSYNLRNNQAQPAPLRGRSPVPGRPTYPYRHAHGDMSFHMCARGRAAIHVRTTIYSPGYHPPSALGFTKAEAEGGR